jgi:hypothetical protein
LPVYFRQSFQNVTIDPEDFTPAVDDPVVSEVISTRSGASYSAPRLIRRIRWRDFLPLRAFVRELALSGRPRFICPHCGKGLDLISIGDKSAFFRHFHKDGAACEERKNLPEATLRAIKYRGARESNEHKRAKALIAASLAADPRFRDTAIEKTWRGDIDPETLRRPDVQTWFKDLHIAFEVQLATTFLSEIVGRRRFYCENGGLLIWIVPRFQPSYRRMTDDQLLFINNSNVLIVDERTLAASQETGRLTFRCWIAMPLRSEKGTIENRWEERLVAWDDLTRDLPGQRIYAADVDAQRRNLTPLVEGLEGESPSERYFSRLNELRSKWIAFLLEAQRLEADMQYCLQNDLVNEGGAFCAPEPHDCIPSKALLASVKGIESAYARVPVGSNFKTLIQVAHHAFDQVPASLIPFCCAVKDCGADAVLAEQDKTGKWDLRMTEIRKAIRNGDPKLDLHRADRRFLEFLYPDLEEAMTAAWRVFDKAAEL